MVIKLTLPNLPSNKYANVKLDEYLRLFNNLGREMHFLVNMEVYADDVPFILDL